MKRVLATLTVFMLLLTFSSCRFSNDDKILRYDIGSDPITFDPQAVDDEAGRIVLAHVMEGLITKDTDGKIVEACAENYSITDDGLTYTFTLKKDLVWSDGSTLTSDDFMFAFTRLFLPETHAADISQYMCIKNAEQIYKGTLPVEQLGISAPDDRTFIIELDYKNTAFLETLTSVSASPCNRSFFEKSKGKYGVDQNYMIYNNRFIISDHKVGNYITLRPNSHYRNQSAIKSDGINFYTSSDLDIESRFLSGTTEIATLPTQIVNDLDPNFFKTAELYCKTWVLGFNQQKEIFKNQNLRTALALCATDIDKASDTSDLFSAADRIIPPDVTTHYKPSEISTSETPFSLYKAALSELELEKLPTISICCPDYYDFKLYITYLQKSWMQKLGLAINLEVLDEESFEDALESGSFDIILFPVIADSNTPLSVLNRFNSLSVYNYLGYTDNMFDLLLTDASQETDEDSLNYLMSEAETHLIENAVVYPVFYEKQYLGINKRVEDILVNPFGPEIYFGYAYKK